MVKYSLSSMDKAFGALANAHRRGIISALALQPLSINTLAEWQSLSLPAIHKHIKILEGCNLVHRRKIGRSNFLALNYEGLKHVQDWLHIHQTHWGSAKATLTNYQPAQRPTLKTKGQGS
jgi:DNA-binding transcriptional ArsR family regulator